MKRMKNNLGRIAAGLLLAGLAWGAVSCAEKKNAPDVQGALRDLRIGYPTSGGDWPIGLLGVARDRGYLDEYLGPLGYKASLHGFVGAAPAIHEALVAKELDYVIYAGMAAVLSKSNGIGHTLLSVTNWGSDWKLLVREGAGINSPADLKGKKVAYTRGASPHMYLIRVLNEGGLTFNDIEALNTTLPEGIAGLVSRTIDATVVSAGREAELVANGTAKVIHTGFTANRDVYYEPSVFIGRTEAYQADRDAAAAIQQALLKAKAWAAEDPDRYFQLLAEKRGDPLSLILETAEYDFDISSPLNLNVEYIDALKKIETFLRDNALITGSIDFNSWVDPYAVNRARDEYGREK
ncbi:MAG: ABC transporter substrate-binding protein [Spirochaetaceae bacterium]|jgi:sulfonate transport system substrate-binding protein|nr:ABC transporter substrate-binding protein [Spirochaetaceae bacterium]